MRQGNYDINKIYIYIDRSDVSSVDVRYLLESGLLVGPQNYSEKVNEEIPFDPKRDLYWFEYHKTYRFIVVDLEADVNGNGPLDQTGNVHCNIEANLTSGILSLGELNFNVEMNHSLNQKQVANQ